MFARDCRPLDEIFSHEDTDGVSRHFNTTAMIRAILSEEVTPMRAKLDLYEELVHNVESNHGVEEDHIEKVSSKIESPIIVVEFEDQTNLIVDGNHRVVKRWRMGLTDIHAVILKPGQWEQFLVGDMTLPREYYAIKKEVAV